MLSTQPSQQPLPQITVKPSRISGTPVKFLPPLPSNAIQKMNIFSNPLPNKNEVHVGSLVRKLKEDRIVEVMNRQMEILEDLKMRISNKTEIEQKKLSDYVERLEKEREDFLKQQRYEELIKERVEKKIRDYLSYGMGYNPYYPSLLPYLIFNLPKVEKKKEIDEDKEEKTKKKKKGKKKKEKSGDKKKLKIADSPDNKESPKT